MVYSYVETPVHPDIFSTWTRDYEHFYYFFWYGSRYIDTSHISGSFTVQKPEVQYHLSSVLNGFADKLELLGNKWYSVRRSSIQSLMAPRTRKPRSSFKNNNYC